MHGRRVGTLTLGLTLICLGIIYLLINIFNLPIEAIVVKLWPITFISLGIETLYYHKYALKTNSSVKFDGMSFFLIIVMVFTAFGAYGISKFATEFFNPDSPLFYKNHMHIGFTMFLINQNIFFI